jgi:hypothetical protein
MSADSTVHYITKNILIFTVHLSKVKLIALFNENAVFFFKELYFNAILSFSICPTVVRQPTSLAPTDRPRHLFKSNCKWLCLAIRGSYTHHLNEEGLFHMLACVIHVLAKFECVWYCGSCCGCGLKKVVSEKVLLVEVGLKKYMFG